MMMKEEPNSDRKSEEGSVKRKFPRRVVGLHFSISSRFSSKLMPVFPTSSSSYGMEITGRLGINNSPFPPLLTDPSPYTNAVVLGVLTLGVSDCQYQASQRVLVG